MTYVIKVQGRRHYLKTKQFIGYTYHDIYHHEDRGDWSYTSRIMASELAFTAMQKGIKNVQFEIRNDDGTLLMESTHLHITGLYLANEHGLSCGHLVPLYDTELATVTRSQNSPPQVQLTAKLESYLKSEGFSYRSHAYRLRTYIHPLDREHGKVIPRKLLDYPVLEFTNEQDMLLFQLSTAAL